VYVKKKETQKHTNHVCKCMDCKYSEVVSGPYINEYHYHCRHARYRGDRSCSIIKDEVKTSYAYDLVLYRCTYHTHMIYYDDDSIYNQYQLF